jgi:hypothetical protein
MNDAEFEALRSRLWRIIEEWSGVCGIGTWSLRSIYYRDDYPYTSRGDGFAAVMHCDVSWQYQSICLHVNMPEANKVAEDELAFDVVHEFLHGITDEMSHWKAGSHEDGHMEHMVVTLTNVVKWAYRKGWNDGRGGNGNRDGGSGEGGREAGAPQSNAQGML